MRLIHYVLESLGLLASGARRTPVVEPTPEEAHMKSGSLADVAPVEASIHTNVLVPYSSYSHIVPYTSNGHQNDIGRYLGPYR